MLLFFLLQYLVAEPLKQSVVQVWVDKQQLRSVALGRLSEEYDIPLYFRLPLVQEWGTGVVLDTTIVVTNYHVVQGAKNLGIQTSSSEIIPASIIGTLPDMDLAWLRLEDDLALLPWAIGTATSLEKDIFVGGFDTPLGWSDTVASIVELNQKDILGDERQNFMVLDRSVNPGYSGGPVWNERNELLGIIAATNPEKGESYAIPVQDMLWSWKELQKGEQQLWGELGFRVANGRVVSVNPYSPARKIPIGTIHSVQGVEVTEAVLDAELRRIRKGDTLLIVVDAVEYQLRASDLSDWSVEEGDCFWLGAQLKREEIFWRIVSIKKDSPLTIMGARPNDLLLVEEDCSQLPSVKTKLVSLERDGFRYELVLLSAYQR